MDIIELERWKPSADNPRKLEYAGQPTAEEVFQELKHRLEGMGCLPDEYFLLDMDWENGRKIPREADIFCTTDYGASEGVYLDVYLKWYEDGKPIIKSFITGKTLGEGGDDLDRMFLISAAITKAFHGDHATHARYMKAGGVEEDTGGSVVHLSPQEQRTIIEALVEQRERQEDAMSQTEQLLRRMTGGITAYLKAVGKEPLLLSNHDRASLAVLDGDTDAFKELWPKAADRADELIVEVASRSGNAARRMMDVVLSGERRFPGDVYRAACWRAVDAADDTMVEKLLSQADRRMEGYTPALFGETACYGYQKGKGWLARQVVDWCGPEQAAAPPLLLVEAVEANDFAVAWKLSEGGIDADDSFAYIIGFYAGKGHPQMAADLLRQGMVVSADNYQALAACIEYGCLDAGKQLLERGMNLDQYEEWAKVQHHGLRVNDTLDSLREYWQTLQAQAQEQESTGPENGGMTFG